MKIYFTRASNIEGAASGKHFRLKQDGSLDSKVEGSRRRLRLSAESADSPEDLAEVLRTAAASDHLLAAVVGHSDAIALPACLMKRALDDGQTADEAIGLPLVGLTASFLKRAEAGGLLAIDADGMSGAEARAAVLRAVPALAGAAMVVTSSSSSCIYNTQGVELRGNRGSHIFIGIADGTDADRAIRVLHQRCWVTGSGVGKLSETGSFLERSPVDRALAAPTQPIFIRATLGTGLEQRKTVDVFPGVWGIDSSSLIPDLSTDERAEYARAVADARRALGAAALTTRAAYVQRRTDELVQAHAGRVTEADARGVVAAALDGGELGPEFRLCVEGAWVTVADVLRNPTAFHGRPCRDPLEPDYGTPTVAKLFTDGGSPCVHSFAHGGRTYRLAERPARQMTAEEILAEFREVETETIQRLAGDADLQAWLDPAVRGVGKEMVPCADGAERPAREVAAALLANGELAIQIAGPDRRQDVPGLRYRLQDGRVVQIWASVPDLLDHLVGLSADDPDAVQQEWAAITASALYNPAESSIATDLARALRLPVAGLRRALSAALDAQDEGLRALHYRATPHAPAEPIQTDPDEQALDIALCTPSGAALQLADQYGIDCERGRLKKVGGDLKLIGRVDARGNPLPDITAIHGGNPRIEALMRSCSSDAWGRVLAFENLDGVTHRVLIQMALLEGDAAGVRSEAAGKGLLIDPVPEAALAFLTFVKLYPTSETYRSTAVVGWNDGVYVMPDRSYGPGAETVIYSSNAGRVAATEFEQRGTASEWRDNVAGMAAGNSRLTLVACVGFAGPLLQAAGAESGFIHIHSHSSGGKTSISHLMASMYGPPSTRKRSWRATANALESVAAGHNDCCLWLDEIAQAKADEVDSVVYTIGNGAGKLRSDRSGAVRQGFTWRTLALSNGEVALETLLNRAGHVLDAGLAVRMVSVLADAGAGMGVWDVLPDWIESPAEASNVLVERCGKYYGAVGRAWVEHLAGKGKDLDEQVARAIQAAQAAMAPEKPLAPQAQRVLSRFALLGAAGELATAAGLTGWSRGWAVTAIKRCLTDWLDTQGGGGDQLEDARAVDVVRSFLQTQISRFVQKEDVTSTSVRDVAGVIVGSSPFNSGSAPIAFWIYPSVFRDEICRDIDHRQVAKALIAKGFLKPSPDKKSARSERIGNCTTRVYVISASIFGDTAG